MARSDIQDLTDEIADWANEALPGRAVSGTAKKLCEEVVELFEAVLIGDNNEVAEEVADCLILILDIADRYSIDTRRAVKIKLEINKRRNWKVRNDSLTHDS